MKNSSSLKQGYHTYNSNSGSAKSNPKNLDISSYKYPKGYLPAIFIMLVCIVLLIVCFVLLKKQWYDALLISFGISFCLECFWLIFRQNFGLQTKYGIRNIKDQIIFKKKLINKNILNSDNAQNNVQNFEDYILFTKIRTKRSRLVFWLSFGFHGIVLLSVIIATIIYIYSA